MKAIRVHEFGDPEVLKYQDVPDPTPGPGQVVVRVRAIGVNPVETYIRAGKYGPRPFPFTPGADCAGEIDAVGPGMTAWKVGDRVYTAATISGAYAQRALCDAGKVFRLPPDVSFEQGAALGVPAGTAYRAQFDPRQAMLRDADIRGMTLMNVTDAELLAIHAAIAAAVEAKVLRPIIDTTMPLTDAARAHREILEGDSRGKILLIP